MDGRDAKAQGMGRRARHAQGVCGVARGPGVRRSLTTKPFERARGSSGETPGKPRRAATSIPIEWRKLGQSEHFSLERDVFHNILRVTRLSDAYPSTQALKDAHRWLLKTFQEFDRPTFVVVWDGRRGKLRNDPEFEEALKEVLPAVTEGWREFISINNTPVMKVQFHRWIRERISGAIRTFNDEREALDYAVNASTGRSPNPDSQR